MNENGESKAKPKSQSVFLRALSPCSIAKIVWKALGKYSLTQDLKLREDLQFTRY